MENKLEKGALYVVGTPIGNLSDMTERAKYILSECDFVACEDTRVSGKLLNLFGIKKSLVSYHEHNKIGAAEGIIERLQNGETGAIVTDAGMPAISDPGEDLVRECKERGIKVIPVPGACAFVSALAASGFPSRRFCFEGFLPTDKKERDEVLSSYATDKKTVIFYEAPHRLAKTLDILYSSLGDRKICIARELTKLNEEIYTTTLQDAVKEYETRTPRGEYVLVIEGHSGTDTASIFDNMTVQQHVEFYIDKGLSKMDAIKACAKDRKVPKNEIYKEFI
jgi:16S rRNA (cytidine1402-2'-O)-methyltransferase